MRNWLLAAALGAGIVMFKAPSLVWAEDKPATPPAEKPADTDKPKEGDKKDADKASDKKEADKPADSKPAEGEKKPAETKPEEKK